MKNQDKKDERKFYERMFSNLKGIEDGACLTYGYDDVYKLTVDKVAPGTLVDIGSGAGRQSVNLAARGFSVVGVELSWAGIVAARKWAEHNKQRVLFVQADVEQLPFKDRAFDYAFCGLIFHHFPDQAPLVKEVARVVEKNVFALETNALEPMTFLKFNIRNAFFGHPAMSRNQRAVFPGKLRKLFLGAGFSDMRFDWLSNYAFQGRKRGMRSFLANSYILLTSWLPQPLRSNKFAFSASGENNKKAAD